jgi:SNF2 family DNA or RNA helicase
VENNFKAIKTPFPLRDYQQDGIKFLYNQKNVLLADEMGLGKTIQAMNLKFGAVFLNRDW